MPYRASLTAGATTSVMHTIPTGISGFTHFGFTPVSAFVDIEIADSRPFAGSGGSHTLRVYSFTIDTVTYIPQTVVSTISSGDDYHYGFNGQMKDNEWAGVGNYLDFGERGYDTRIARFHSLDPFAKKFPSESNYIFAGNNPISNIDVKGAFKLDAIFIKKYPNFAKLVANAGEILSNNIYARGAWMKTINVWNGSAFDKMVTYNSGPFITPSRHTDEWNAGLNQNLRNYFDNEDAYMMGVGEFDKHYRILAVNRIYIKQYESAVNNYINNKGSLYDAAYQTAKMVTIIMHEGTHWGGFQYNGDALADPDGGAKWEAGAWGVRISYGNEGTATVFGQEFNEEVFKREFDKQIWGGSEEAFKKTIYYKQLMSTINSPVPNAGSERDPTVIENGGK
jgi:RHS repeat-associated protein